MPCAVVPPAQPPPPPLQPTVHLAVHLRRGGRQYRTRPRPGRRSRVGQPAAIEKPTRAVQPPGSKNAHVTAAASCPKRSGRGFGALSTQARSERQAGPDARSCTAAAAAAVGVAPSSARARADRQIGPSTRRAAGHQGLRQCHSQQPKHRLTPRGNTLHGMLALKYADAHPQQTQPGGGGAHKTVPGGGS